MTFASACFAASRARSAVRVAKALIRGSSRSIRASTVSTISTGESSRAATIAASRVAGVKHRSSSFIGPSGPSECRWGSLARNSRGCHRLRGTLRSVC